MDNDVINKIDEIIRTIEDSPIYQKYLDLKEQIDQNSKLKTLINEVRVLQKDVVHKVKENDILESKLNELNSHPLYIEYINTLDDINNTFSIIENSLNNYFNNKLN